MHELHTSVFRELLPPGCDECMHPSECGRPFALSENGLPTRHDDPTAVVRWPRCPVSYDALREAGQDNLRLNHLVAWAHERGVHRDERAGAGTDRLISEWLRIREVPAVLKLRRDAKERE